MESNFAFLFFYTLEDVLLFFRFSTRDNYVLFLLAFISFVAEYLVQYNNQWPCKQSNMSDWHSTSFFARIDHIRSQRFCAHAKMIPAVRPALKQSQTIQQQTLNK